MTPFLTSEQSIRYEEFRAFAASDVMPYAGEWDKAQKLPTSIIKGMADRGYLGPCIPPSYGGRGWDVVTFGLLNEALGRADSGLTGLVTVQAMASMPLVKWGTREQRDEWLPRMARGEVIAAFALTEPGAGSDLESMRSEYRPGAAQGDLILRGEKKWITAGQIADVFLVFGKLDGAPVAALVPRTSAGVHIEPIQDLLGFRSSALARLHFDDVVIPRSNVIGKPGFALSHIAPFGLQYGRISTACSALGLLRGCLEESASFAASRRIGTKRAADLGMVQSLIARMGCDLQAANLLCWSACRGEDDRSPDTFIRACTAKYFVSRSAVRAASDAIQIHGAAGCHESSPVSRYYRASKIMEIIEGTTQVHETILGEAFVQWAGGKDAVAPGKSSRV